MKGKVIQNNTSEQIEETKVRIKEEMRLTKEFLGGE